MANHVDAVAYALRKYIVHDVDADVLVGEQGPWRAQQEHRWLKSTHCKFEPRVR